MASEFLFVYGTLRRSFPLHRILASVSAKYIGNGHIRGRLYNLGPYPGVYQPPRGVGHVVGEVYELLAPETQLKKLDHEEDFKPETPKASLFIRRKTQVHLVGGRRLTAWAYFLPRKPLHSARIPHGDYKKLAAHARLRH